ncbi:MAG: 4Fe-4S dicluster domain-containing protein [Planctomycetota bacterium]
MKTIAKEKIADLLNILAREYELYAPVSQDGLSCDFEHVDSAEKITLDFYNTAEPPKKLFFPQKETLYSFDADGRAEPAEVKSGKQRIIFGVRPCDLRSFRLLDRIFNGKYQDPYYIERRKNTVLFGLACNDPQSSCFCTALGFGPHFKDDCDVFVIDLGRKYLFEPVSDKGREVLDKIPGLVDSATEDIEFAEKLKKQAEENIDIDKELDMEGLAEKLLELYDSRAWDEIHQRCLACGICTFLCPTCHCFDLLDEAGKDKFRKLRVWDSCMYENFNLEASGHNPRATGKERMRQRIMHKFSYIPRNFDMFGCVGCGRCMRKCPACMNIIKAIEKVRASEVKQSK